MVSPQRSDDTPFLPAMSCVVPAWSRLDCSPSEVPDRGRIFGSQWQDRTLFPKKARTERSYKANARAVSFFCIFLGLLYSYSVKWKNNNKQTSTFLWKFPIRSSWGTGSQGSEMVKKSSDSERIFAMAMRAVLKKMPEGISSSCSCIAYSYGP